MVVLTTATTPQSFVFNSREGVVDSVFIYDKQTREPSVEITDFTVYNDEWNNLFTASFSLVEGRDYLLTMLSADLTILYQTKIFCTDDPSNGYVQHESDNSFVLV